MTDTSIAHSSAKLRPPSAVKKLFTRLRTCLLEAEARRVVRRLPDHLLRDAGLTRGEGSVLGDNDSWDAATRLEIEDLRRRQF